MKFSREDLIEDVFARVFGIVTTNLIVTPETSLLDFSDIWSKQLGKVEDYDEYILYIRVKILQFYHIDIFTLAEDLLVYDLVNLIGENNENLRLC